MVCVIGVTMVGDDNERHHVAILRALRILRDGLGPYVLHSYREIPGVSWESEFQKVIPRYRLPDLSDDKTILKSVDLKGWLELLLRQRLSFQELLGPAAVAHVDELMQVQSDLASDQHFAIGDVERIYDTVARLLRSIARDDLDVEIKRALEPLQSESNNAAHADRSFAAQLRTQMALIGKIIDELTYEQYRIIEYLRTVKRAAISGCAGSGKTLVAAEKAIRLNNAGCSTLILCHSPFLAAHFRYLLKDSPSIKIWDFVEWVASVLGKTADSNADWVHYYEPTESELFDAEGVLRESTSGYDAIIVDEGQDFRATWWGLIEHAFAEREKGILYIFHDDRQAMLPQRSQYPIADYPYPMSKNCRNAGAIYGLIQFLNPDAPSTSRNLIGSGVVRRTLFSGKWGFDAVRAAIVDASKIFAIERLVVITNEPVAPRQSVLQDLHVTIPVPFQWQAVVRGHLAAIERQVNRRLQGRGSAGPSGRLTLPELSDGSKPTNDDVANVIKFTRKFTPNAHGPVIGTYWRTENDELVLKGGDHVMSALSFFASESWAEGLPQPKEVVVRAEAHLESSHSVALWTTDTFKGLEADAVIFFIRKTQQDLATQLYVGMSRARLYLNVVADGNVLSSAPVLELLNDIMPMTS